jgi:RNA polymerase sigma factor (sigma-70 family)
MMVTMRADQKRALSELAGEAVTMANQIASRLHRSYGWVGVDDLRSYAYLGLVLAEKAYDPTMGVPFVKYAWRKAAFLAIDEMRKDGTVCRKNSHQLRCAPLTFETADPQGEDVFDRVDTNDLYDSLMDQLRDSERELLAMYYADGMTFKEISEIFGISESAACLRHKATIRKLRGLMRSRARPAA